MGDAPEGRFARALGHPRAGLWAALLAVALVLPTLGAGLMLDDWMHRMVMDPAWWHPGSVRGRWDLYRFIAESPEYRRIAMDRGIFPWWTVEHFRLAFLRPLSSLSIAFDHVVLRSAWAMHLENALWYGAMTLAALAVYRRALPRARVAALAALLFAVDHTHAMIAVWISNRHAMLSAVFGFASLAAHVRWREGWRAGALAAPLLFAVSLLCGESTLALGGYLLAWTLWNDPAPRNLRWRALAPYALVVVAWAALYRAQGYGAYGGDYYIDPVRQPGSFLHAVVERAPVLLLAQFALPPAEFFAHRTIPLSLAVLAALALALWPLWKLVRAEPTARTWLVGALVALLPGCATLPNDRLLLFPGLGALALLALAFERAWWSPPRPSLAARVVVGTLAFVHLALSPALLPLRALVNARVSTGYLDRIDGSVPSDGALRGQMLVAASAPDTLGVMYAITRRVPEGRAVPASVRLLTVPAAGTTTLRRDGERSLVLTSTEGVPHDMIGVIYRGAEHPSRVGDVAATAGMRAEVLSVTPGGRARDVRFTWDAPLEDARYRWVRWRNNRYEPFAVPALGESVTLEPIDWFRAMAGE